MKNLQARCLEKGPLCVGLDTDPSYIPESVLKKYASPSEAVFAYNEALINELAENAGCFKVQIAYYEAMGLAGLKAYSKTLKLLGSKNIPVIADVKRGDIADTARAYAKAHFEGDFEADIITLNPYMGFDTLEPFLEYATSKGKGAFVLLRTSNKGMRDIENLELAGSNKFSYGGELTDSKIGFASLHHVGTNANSENKIRVLDSVALALKKIAARFEKEFGFEKNSSDFVSPIGAVVGCTETSEAKLIRDRHPELFFLIPGYGAQGGGAALAASLLKHSGGTVNSSRGILTAWKNDSSLKEKIKKGNLTLNDIVYSAYKAAENAKNDLLKNK